MDASAITLPTAGRCRGRYSDTFKAEIVAACKAPGVSTAAVALANGLNASVSPGFVPLALNAPSADIRIELRQGDQLITVYWPMAAAA